MQRLDGKTQLGVVLHVVTAGHDVIDSTRSGCGERVVAIDILDRTHGKIARLGEQRRDFIGQRQREIVERCIAGRVLESHHGHARESGRDALFATTTPRQQHGAEQQQAGCEEPGLAGPAQGRRRLDCGECTGAARR